MSDGTFFPPQPLLLPCTLTKIWSMFTLSWTCAFFHG